MIANSIPEYIIRRKIAQLKKNSAMRIVCSKTCTGHITESLNQKLIQNFNLAMQVERF